MKPRTQRLSALPKPVLLYREHVEQIIEAMQEVASSVTLSTDTHHYDDVKEWAESKRDYFTELEIVADEPVIKLELGKKSITLCSESNTAQVRGAFEKIKAMLDKQSRLLLKPWIPGVVLVLSLLQFFWSLPPEARTDPHFVIPLNNFCLLALAILWMVWVFHNLEHKYSLIIPKYATDAPNFWKRNSDKILLAAISAAIGSLLTLLIQSLFKKGG